MSKGQTGLDGALLRLIIILTVTHPRLTLPPGVRPTRQRRAILAAIEAAPGVFTVAELQERIREDGVGAATVYRTVELLRESGSLRQLGAGTYVRCHPGHHHHLVCVSCGAVEETELCAAPPARELRRRYGFRAEWHQFDVFGTCRRCAA
jgi:Fur family transcriptional regulator, ferric uptake regulator